MPGGCNWLTHKPNVDLDTKDPVLPTQQLQYICYSAGARDVDKTIRTDQLCMEQDLLQHAELQNPRRAHWQLPCQIRHLLKHLTQLDMNKISV